MHKHTGEMTKRNTYKYALLPWIGAKTFTLLNQLNPAIPYGQPPVSVFWLFQKL